MSLVYIAKREGRVIVLVGLNREDVDHLIGGEVIFLESRLASLPDMAVFAGELQEDLEAHVKEMEKPKP